MFGISMPELILILAIALIIIGPKKLPDIAKSLGRAIGEFKKAASDLKKSIEIDDEINDVKQTFDDVKKNLKANVDTQSVKADTGQKNDQNTKDR